ncbi:MAG TPA: hypothetical protein VGL58_13695 [Caulobacteraceae bacterium]|jgi:hypothetical protein
MALTPDQLQSFARDGFVAVRGAFPHAAALSMQDEWWAELADDHGVRREDPATWRPVRGDLKRPKTAPSQAAFGSAAAGEVIDQLLGKGGWDWPRDWGRAIAGFPSGASLDAWDVPADVWHWDGATAWNLDHLTSLFIVAFVGAVEAGGGGTTALAGSQELVRRQYRALPAAQRAYGETWRRDRLWRSDPWLAALTGCAESPTDRVQAFMRDGGKVDGVPLRVVELTGEPGDMVFCDPLLLHAVARNCREQPRLMRIKQQFLSREAVALAKASQVARA